MTFLTNIHGLWNNYKNVARHATRWRSNVPDYRVFQKKKNEVCQNFLKNLQSHQNFPKFPRNFSIIIFINFHQRFINFFKFVKNFPKFALNFLNNFWGIINLNFLQIFTKYFQKPLRIFIKFYLKFTKISSYLSKNYSKFHWKFLKIFKLCLTLP